VSDELKQALRTIKKAAERVDVPVVHLHDPDTFHRFGCSTENFRKLSAFLNLNGPSNFLNVQRLRLSRNDSICWLRAATSRPS
jgi:hypothetical protein